MKYDRETQLNFECVVMDLIEELHPESVDDYESIAEWLHESIETAIMDEIMDDDNVDAGDYRPSY